MTVDGGGVHGSDRLIDAVYVQEIPVRESDRRRQQAAGFPRTVHEDLLVAFTLRIAVIGAFGDDIDLLPIVQADIVYEQRFRSDIPIHPVRIPQTVCVNFAASVGDRYKGIRIRASRRNAVTSVRAEPVFRMQIYIRSDSQNLAHEGIELLREGMSRPRRCSLG